MSNKVYLPDTDLNSVHHQRKLFADLLIDIFRATGGANNETQPNGAELLLLGDDLLEHLGRQRWEWDEAEKTLKSRIEKLENRSSDGLFKITMEEARTGRTMFDRHFALGKAVGMLEKEKNQMTSNESRLREIIFPLPMQIVSYFRGKDELDAYRLLENLWWAMAGHFENEKGFDIDSDVELNQFLSAEFYEDAFHSHLEEVVDENEFETIQATIVEFSQFMTTHNLWADLANRIRDVIHRYPMTVDMSNVDLAIKVKQGEYRIVFFD